MKILWISDCPDNKVHTGYATATRLIAAELMRRGHQFVFGSQGSQEANVEEVLVETFSCKSYGFGKGKFLSGEAVKEIDMIEKPDLIVTLADWQMVEGMMQLSNHPAFLKWICYAPVDGDMMSGFWNLMIYSIPFLLYMSPKFGPSVCQRRRFGYTDFIPLPLNVNNYKVMPPQERKALQTSAKVGSGWTEDTITVLTVARNQWRKNYPEIVRAAALLKKSDPRKFSFAFHCKASEAAGWNIPELLRYYDVSDCVALSEQDLTESDIHKLYNSGDVFLLPSLGEGFGIPIIEAALCELPIFTTSETASWDIMEMLGANMQGLSFNTLWQAGPTIPRPYVQAEEIARALRNYVKEGCAYDVKLIRSRAERMFSVTTVCDAWEKLIVQARTIMRQRYGDFTGGVVRGNLGRAA